MEKMHIDFFQTKSCVWIVFEVFHESIKMECKSSSPKDKSQLERQVQRYWIVEIKVQIENKTPPTLLHLQFQTPLVRKSDVERGNRFHLKFQNNWASDDIGYIGINIVQK